MIIREADPQDLVQLVTLRLQLFRELDATDPDPAMADATRRFIAESFANGQARFWVAEDEGTLAATACLAFFQRPPYPGNLGGREAYLLNMYTAPAYRRRGLAAQLLTAATRYATAAGFGKVWLHASDDGRALYEQFGFRADPAYMDWTP